jgi:hypothetical protein
MKKVIRVTETDLEHIVKRVIDENINESTLKMIKQKLKGVSDDQVIHNMKNDLPWDWKDSKESYLIYIMSNN